MFSIHLETKKFEEYYNKLIMFAITGNIYSFHKIMDIKYNYKRLNLYKNEISPIEISYYMMLNGQIEQGLN